MAFIITDELFMSPDFSALQFLQEQDLKIGTLEFNINDISVVSSSKMLLCDPARKKVNLVDSTAGGVIASVSVPGGPKRICLLDEEMAAVSLEGRKIQFIKVEHCSLTLDSVLGVSNDICGITMLDNKLITSFTDPPGVQMMSLDGKVMYTVDNQKAGRNVFKQPYFLTTSMDGFIYVSDWNNHTVTKLDQRLNVLRIYNDPSLQLPRGIISISRDQLLVCSIHNHSISLLNTRTGNTTVLLGWQDGLKTPWALSYCPTERKLFVAPLGSSTIIQTYKLV